MAAALVVTAFLLAPLALAVGLVGGAAAAVAEGGRGAWLAIGVAALLSVPLALGAARLHLRAAGMLAVGDPRGVGVSAWTVLSVLALPVVGFPLVLMWVTERFGVGRKSLDVAALASAFAAYNLTPLLMGLGLYASLVAPRRGERLPRQPLGELRTGDAEIRDLWRIVAYAWRLVVASGVWVGMLVLFGLGITIARGFTAEGGGVYVALGVAFYFGSRFLSGEVLRWLYTRRFRRQMMQLLRRDEAVARADFARERAFRYTLYLRSHYAEDRQVLDGRWSLHGLLRRFLVGDDRAATPSEWVQEAAGQAGQVVSVGVDTGEDTAPQVDVCGQIIADVDSWKAKVGDLIQHAGFIVMIPGHSEGGVWELGQLQRLGALDKTVMVMLPAGKDSDFAADWARLRERCPGLCLPAHDPDGVLLYWPEGESVPATMTLHGPGAWIVVERLAAARVRASDSGGGRRDRRAA